MFPLPDIGVCLVTVEQTVLWTVPHNFGNSKCRLEFLSDFRWQSDIGGSWRQLREKKWLKQSARVLTTGDSFGGGGGEEEGNAIVDLDTGRRNETVGG